MKYTYTPIARPKIELPSKLASVDPICLDLLYGRGIKAPEDMEAFLFPSLSDALKKRPTLLDTEKAVQILIDAYREKTPVTIYHDYDADGITAGAIAMDAISRLGIPTNLYCNDRLTGGFGINRDGIDEIMQKYPETKIILTVDNGITGQEGIARAKALGLKVIVTDHHLPDAVLPDADAILDNHRADEPKTQDQYYCGAGVVWKLMFSLYQRVGNIEPILNLLDIVALGTIADVVPLLGDNRVFVQEGLKQMNTGRRPFFNYCINFVLQRTIDSTNAAFQIAPMLNAVSRMGKDPSSTVRLLLADAKTVPAGVDALMQNNQMRKAETKQEMDWALAAMKKAPEGAIVFADPRLKEGIVGIIAGRLKEIYELPAIVLTQDKDGNWKGSARGPDQFHMKEALDQCAEYLIRYGGHAKAAGLTIKKDALQKFKEKFTTLALQAAREMGFCQTVPIDLVLSTEDYTEELVRHLSILEPFGEGFPQPLFGLRAHIEETVFMGESENHVKYKDHGLEIIQWNKGPEAKRRATPPSKFVGYPQINTYLGNTKIQFIAR